MITTTSSSFLFFLASHDQSITLIALLPFITGGLLQREGHLEKKPGQRLIVELMVTQESRHLITHHHAMTVIYQLLFHWIHMSCYLKTQQLKMEGTKILVKTVDGNVNDFLASGTFLHA